MIDVILCIFASIMSRRIREGFSCYLYIRMQRCQNIIIKIPLVWVSVSKCFSYAINLTIEKGYVVIKTGKGGMV
jgi:hypothetical protein